MTKQKNARKTGKSVRATAVVQFARQDGSSEALRLVTPEIGFDMRGNAALDDSREAMQVYVNIGWHLDDRVSCWLMTERFSQSLGIGLSQRATRLWDAAWMLRTGGRQRSCRFADSIAKAAAVFVDLDERNVVGVVAMSLPAPGGTRIIVVDLDDEVAAQHDDWTFGRVSL